MFSRKSKQLQIFPKTLRIIDHIWCSRLIRKCVRPFKKRKLYLKPAYLVQERSGFKRPFFVEYTMLVAGLAGAAAVGAGALADVGAPLLVAKA